MTGTPGVGKTTITKILAEKLGFKIIELNKFAIEVNGIIGYDSEKDAQIINEKIIKRELRKILEKENNFIIEGHWGEIVPKDFVDIVIVIRTNPLVLRERLRKKGYKEEKIKENVQAELLDYCLIKAIEAFGEDKVFEVDNTNKEINVVVDEIIKIIKERKGNKPGKIDWIETLGDKVKEIL
ncbi:MAG: adenylate kinase family protein [Candidatus Verstraetearchaeota archaeon]|nr:adenylate kinase family protein [Candidatus Verstraetearchaeota archaeon]